MNKLRNREGVDLFFFGDHPNFCLLFQIRTLGSIIKPSNALHRPAFVREIIEVSINLVKFVLLHRVKKRDFRSKQRDKASKSGTYGNPSPEAMFLSNAKSSNLQSISGGFTVKIQWCIKISGSFW